MTEAQQPDAGRQPKPLVKLGTGPELVRAWETENARFEWWRSVCTDEMWQAAADAIASAVRRQPTELPHDR